jgi:hypothetical protein
MNWITNHPQSIKGMWPRRIGCDYIEGLPKATDTYTVEQLINQNIIGVYVDMPIEEYRLLPTVRSPKEIK